MSESTRVGAAHPAGWWPWGLAIVVVLGSAAGNREADPRGPVAIGVVMALTAVLPAAVRVGAWPALLVSGLATGVYFAAGYADGPVYFGLPAVAFAVASRERPGSWGRPAAVGLTLGVSGVVARSLLHDLGADDGSWQALGLTAVTVAMLAVATALGARRQAEADRSQRAATEERLRMAQDLHDGVGHGLAVIAMQAGAALHVLDNDPAAARRNLEAVRSVSRESLDALRAELSRLAGETPAVRRPAAGLAALDELVERVRGGGLDVRVRGDAGDHLGDATDHTAYAVVQEALTNVLRHAGAAHAEIELVRTDEALEITVTDDGVGSGAATGDGMGLRGMRHRVEGVGGELDAGPADVGYRVRAVLPAARIEADA